ncbi:MAG: hypothetical protein BWK79_11635 [Beggiatoa sp. IS2]|nr:MAG: hypothetical protein BWK79_11635 [Beggiatoa sp. IS2]
MRSLGFTLLEAIVALVLITTSGMALLNWINTNLLALEHVQQAQQRHMATRNALAFMETVNPLEKPNGEMIFDDYTIKWETTAVELPKDGINAFGDVGFFQIGLYDTQVEVDSVDKMLARFTLRQVGYKQVREPTEFF